jgi:hypothetical protein
MDGSFPQMFIAQITFIFSNLNFKNLGKYDIKDFEDLLYIPIVRNS